MRWIRRQWARLCWRFECWWYDYDERDAWPSAHDWIDDFGDR